MPPTSRLPIDPTTHLPSIHTFGELSNFLRSAVADENSRVFSESMALLASHIEAIVAALQLDRRRQVVGPALMDLLTVLRDHRQLVVGLGLEWRGLYEYAAYLQALNNFRVLIGQWLLHDGAQGPELQMTSEDFALVAWRTLGEGMLMIDMYEQIVAQEPLGDSGSSSGLVGDSVTIPFEREIDKPKVERALQWWQKLRL